MHDEQRDFRAVFGNRKFADYLSVAEIGGAFLRQRGLAHFLRVRSEVEPAAGFEIAHRLQQNIVSAEGQHLPHRGNRLHGNQSLRAALGIEDADL